MKKYLIALLVTITLFTSATTVAQSLLFDNGPFVTQTGTGFGGGDISEFQNVTLGYGTLGYGVNNAGPIRLTDQFTNTVPWKLDYVDVFAYQTGSTATSTFTGGVVRIWDGDPSSGTAVSEFGDYTTNRMILTDFTNCYRIQENTSATATNRPIMRIRLNLGGIILQPGTHWVEWGLTGSLASGPFAPNVSILGVGTTGDAKQFNVSGYTGTLTNGSYTIGIPFKLFGGTFVSTAVTPNPVCAGSNILVDFNDAVTRNAGNTYTLELSDAAGNFPGTALTTTVVSPSQLSATIPASTAGGTNYKVRTAASNPAENSSSISLTVNPTNTITISSAAGTDAQTVCINTAITDITYTTTDATGATFSGLPAGVTGSWAANVVTISGTPTAAGTFNYTVTLTGGCGTVTATGTVTVNPIPDVTQPASQVVCNNGSTAAVTFAGSAPGTVFNWTNNTTSIGLAASGTGNIAGFTATNATNSPVVSTVTVTPVYLASNTVTFNYSGAITNWTVPAGVTSVRIVAKGAEGSNNSSASVAPGKGAVMAGDFTVTPGSSLKILVGQQATNNSGNGGGGGTFVTTSTDTPLIVAGGGGGASGGADSPEKDGKITTAGGTGAAGGGAGGTGGNGGSIGGSGFQSGAGGGLLTNGANGWTGGSGGQAFVNGGSGGSVNAPANGGFGGGGSGSSYVVGGGGGGYSGGGSGGNSSAGVGGGGGSYNAGTNQVNTAGANTGNGIVTISYAYGPACTGTATTFTYTVNPTATVNTVANQTICSGANTTAVAFSSPTTGGTIVYNWTNNTTSIGLAASGTGNIASFATTNSGTAPVTATITVTPAYTNGGVTCNGTPTTFTITVNPAATVNAVSNQSLCNSQSTAAVNFSSPATGGTVVYNWTNSAPSIGLAASGTGNIASFTATNTGTVPVVATITVTPAYTNGGVTCTGTPLTFTITVNSSPASTCPANITTDASAGNCSAVVTYTATGSGTITYAFTGATIGSGSGTGSGSVFNTGITTVTITNTASCGNSNCSFTVTVKDTQAPVITCPAQIVACGSQAITYTLPTVTDNCTISTPLNLSQTASNSITPSNSVSCNNGAGHTANGYWRVYDLAALGVTGPYTVNKVIFGVESANAPSGSQPATVKVYTLSGAFTLANLTEVASENIIITNQSGTLITVNLTAPPTVPANAKLVLELFTPDGRPTNSLFYMGSNTGAQTAPNYISASDCGVVNPIDVSGVGYPNMHSVLNAEGVAGGAIVPVQTAGLPSGSTFPVGTTVNTYTATDAAGNTSSCSFNVVVNPIPSVNAISNVTVCNNAATAAISITGPVAGTVYSWTNSNPAIGLATGGTGNIPSFTAVNSTPLPVTATITVTPAYTNAGTTCTGTPITFTITVNPAPTVNTVGNQVVCNNAPTTAVNFTNNNTGTICGTANEGGSITLTAPAGAVFTSINFASYGTPGGTCGSFTIGGCHATNSVAVVSALALGQNSFTVNADNATFGDPCGGTPKQLYIQATYSLGITYNWTNSNPSIGLAASGTGNIASFNGTNTGTAPATGTVTVTPAYTNGGTTCTGTPITFTITVNPTATVNTVANQVVCNNAATTAVTFSSPATGGTTAYNWTNNTTSIGLAASGTGNIASFTATNTTIAPVTATITVTPSYTNGGVTCTGTPRTFTITVNPTATVTPVTNQVVCNGAATTAVTFGSPTTGGTIVYNWTNNTTSIGLAASGTGNIASFTATNTTTAPVTATITVTPSYTNAGVTCTGTATTFTITVNPTATVNAVANQVVCNGANTTAVTFSSPATGGTVVYNWTNNTTSIGLAASGTSNIASFVATNTGTAPLTATITVTPSYTNGGVTCTGTPTTFTITVNPTATINAVANQVVCNGANTTAVNFSSPTTGGTIVYNWTNSNPAIGLAPGGTGVGNIPSFTATNTTAAPIAGTITVTPSYTNAGLTCTGTPISFTITVNPTATVTAVTNQVVCNNAATTAVTFSSPTTGGTIVYNWTNNTTSIGLSASGTGNIASFTATNTTTAPVTATITVTPSYTNAGVTCTGTATTFTITVNPTATVNTVTNQVVCNGANTTAVTFSSPATGGTVVYNWTNNTTSIGLAASGTGNIASFTATNTGTAPVTATITVTPSYTNAGVTCTGTATTFTITVNPTATVNAVTNQVVCNNAATTAVTFTSPTTGGTIVYNWTNNTTSIGLAASGTGNIASFTATNTGTAPVTATITVTPSYTNGSVTCTGTARTFTITVNPTATINAVTNRVVCNNATSGAITFSSPTTGGTIVYNWTNNTTSIGLAAGGTGNLPSFTATNTTTAPVTATITVTPSYTNGGVTCTGTPITFTITVNPTATVNAVANQVLCNTATTTAVTFSSPTTGGTIVYNWTNNTPAIGLAATGTGNIASFTATNTTTAPLVATITVTPAYTNGGVTCTGTARTFTITVNPTATVTAVANQTVCNGSPTTAVTFTSPTTGGTIVYNWTNSNTGIGLAASGTGNIPSFTATNTTTAAITGTITVTPVYTNGGVTCTGTPRTFTITVNTLSTAPTGATASATILCGPGSVTLSAQGGFLGTGASYKWYASACGGTLLGTGATLTNVFVNTTTTYYVRIEGACNTTTCVSVTVTVAAPPAVTLTAVSSNTPNNPVVLHATTSPAGSYVYQWLYNGNIVPNTIGDTLHVPLNNSGTYTVKAISTVSGCSATSNSVDVKNNITTKVYVYPNPSTGIFTVSVYASNQEAGTTNKLMMYDSKGSRIFEKTYTVTPPFTNMKVDVAGRVARGVYYLTVVNSAGKVIASEQVIIAF